MLSALFLSFTLTEPQALLRERFEKEVLDIASRVDGVLGVTILDPKTGDRLTVNGGVVGLTRSLVEELRPRRVNSIHPGIVSDSPYWAEKTAALESYRSQTPTGKLATMADVVGAVAFLLENEAVNGVDLLVDAGWHCR